MGMVVGHTKSTRVAQWLLKRVVEQGKQPPPNLESSP